MKRSLGVAAISLLVAALLTVSTPASADVDVCAANGWATTGAPLRYPIPQVEVLDPPTLVRVYLPPSVAAGTGLAVSLVGTCALSFSVSFQGGQFTDRIRLHAGNVATLVDEGAPIGNYCGHSTGRASVNAHTGDWVSAASYLVFTGGLTGVVNAVPDLANGESCSGTSGADNFIVTGALATTDV